GETAPRPVFPSRARTLVRSRAIVVWSVQDGRLPISPWLSRLDFSVAWRSRLPCWFAPTSEPNLRDERDRVLDAFRVRSLRDVAADELRAVDLDDPRIGEVLRLEVDPQVLAERLRETEVQRVELAGVDVRHEEAAGDAGAGDERVAHDRVDEPRL